VFLVQQSVLKFAAHPKIGQFFDRKSVKNIKPSSIFAASMTNS